MEHVFDMSKSMVLWVFGYGSLLWRAGFEYDERMIGYIKDYRRVFYQGSVLSHSSLFKTCVNLKSL